MANWASTAYVIEGTKESLNIIKNAIDKAIKLKDNRYEEYKASVFLGFPKDVLEDSRLGGCISEEPCYKGNTLRFWAEERWGLQDFEELLRQKFPDIKVYWVVEESGCEVYATNDKEGKYFPERFYVDAYIDGKYYSEYFKYKSDVFKWLYEKTNGRVNTEEKLEAFNTDYDDSEAGDENYIYLHEFSVVE